MLEAAVPFFAEHGFAASTRELARHLGVTQALIYKHFGSKDTFIASVLERLFEGASRRDTSILDDRERPLADRLAAFYSGVGRGSRDHVRLFVRAGLDGWPVPARYGARLTRHVFRPIILALRREAGLAGLAERPLMRGERELAMMLHARCGRRIDRRPARPGPRLGTPVEDVLEIRLPFHSRMGSVSRSS